MNNINAFLDLIGISEGAKYNILVGGGTFSDFSKHPNKIIRLSATLSSSAAGKYQILYKTWIRIATKLGLTDFSPKSQDLACIELLKECGAYNYIINGEFEKAIQKACTVWASFPVVTAITDKKGKTHKAGTSYYGQGGHSLETLKKWYNGFLNNTSTVKKK